MRCVTYILVGDDEVVVLDDEVCGEPSTLPPHVAVHRVVHQLKGEVGAITKIKKPYIYVRGNRQKKLQFFYSFFRAWPLTSEPAIRQ